MGLHSLSAHDWILLISALFGGGALMKALSGIKSVLLVVIQIRDAIVGLGVPDPATGLFQRVDTLEKKVDEHSEIFRLERRSGYERRHAE